MISSQAWVLGPSSNIARISPVPHAGLYIWESMMLVGMIRDDLTYVPPTKRNDATKRLNVARVVSVNGLPESR